MSCFTNNRKVAAECVDNFVYRSSRVGFKCNFQRVFASYLQGVILLNEIVNSGEIMIQMSHLIIISNEFKLYL